MKFILLATAFAITAYAAPTDEWNQYKAEHKKVYTSETENMRRLEQYLKSKEMVEEHNRKYDRGETTYTMAINKFSDWFPEEIKGHYSVKRRESGSGGKPLELPTGIDLPDYKNWVEEGAVTSVKDEGSCISDSAFSTAAAVEALLFIKNNTLIDLSAQELLDCSGHSSCKGGDKLYSYSYIQFNGIRSDKSYPYEAEQKKCRAKDQKPVAFINGMGIVNTEKSMQRVVATVSPIQIMFAADTSFVHYKSGIFDGTCSNDFDHDMLAVGYGTDENSRTDYWLVKNSWGTKWGEEGYVRIVRNKNKCGIGLSATYPVYN